MKALTINEDRKLAVEERPEPVPSDDNIILKIKSASICGTDMRTFLKGNEKITPPRILGHECAGEIVHVGSLAAEKGFKEGDRITLAPAIGCGACKPCKKGHPNMCDNLETIGFQYDGVFAPYLEIPKQAILMDNLIKLPENISYDSATLIEPAACALNGQRYLDIKEGDNVLIYGSGLIGCIHAELAFLKGADQVIMVEPAVKRGEIAKQMVDGITWINPTEQNTKEEVMKLTDGSGADVVITATSVPSVHEEAQELAAKMGRICLFGGLPGESKGFIDSNLIHYKELQICGVHATTADFMREIMKLLESGDLNLEKYIEKYSDIEHMIEAMEAIRDQSVMKVVVHPES